MAIPSQTVRPVDLAEWPEFWPGEQSRPYIESWFWKGITPEEYNAYMRGGLLMAGGGITGEGAFYPGEPLVDIMQAGVSPVMEVQPMANYEPGFEEWAILPGGETLYPPVTDLAPWGFETPTTTTPIVTAGIGALPVLGGIAALTLGTIKALISRYGWTIVRGLLGGVAAASVIKLITAGAPDDKKVSLRKRRKRYSIGANPRINTLLKVAKKVDNIFASYDTRMRKFRGRIRGYRPRTQARYYRPPAPHHRRR